LRFPGIFIIVAKAKTPPAGGSDGSTLNHLVFSVRDAAGIKAKLSAAGLNILRNEPKRFTAEFPDKILVEFVEDHEVANVSFSSFHLTAQDPEALQSWYVKTFGAKKGRRGSVPTAGLPGGELEFDKAPGPPAPTKGRALDHIGFEVRGLREFTRKLAADGMKFDGEYRVLPQDDNLQIAYIIDPEGTRIELTEGFAGR
jgi:catechol 2,3-dioxygenase-like lactoylglutathione lyase family enzyme